MRGKDEVFKGEYELDRGYPGYEPHHASILKSHLEEEMSDEALIAFYEEAVQIDFEQTVFVLIREENISAFVAWAREQGITEPKGNGA